MAVNRVVLCGNLTRDPEVKRTQGGMSIMTFGLAVNDRRKNAGGEYENHANYVDCKMFGNRAENVANYISKGSKVALEGKLSYSSWESKGQKRSKLEVLVDEIEFMDGRKQAAEEQVPKFEVYGEDLPF